MTLDPDDDGTFAWYDVEYGDYIKRNLSLAEVRAELNKSDFIHVTPRGSRILGLPIR